MTSGIWLVAGDRDRSARRFWGGQVGLAGRADGGSMIDKLLLKLRLRDEVSDSEEAVLRGAMSHTVDHPQGRTFIRSGIELTTSNLLIDGVVCRYKDLADGSRQMLELHVPGDFVDLHSFPLKRLDHNVMALVPSTLGVFPHERLQAITQDEPHLSRLLWLSTLLDASIHREWLLSLGRRSAIQRIAHLFCELYIRLGVVKQTQQASYHLPLTQSQISELKGLTPVHVNRTLKELREQAIVTFRSDVVSIHDWKRLQAVAEFDPGYLFMEKRPR